MMTHFEVPVSDAANVTWGFEVTTREFVDRVVVMPQLKMEKSDRRAVPFTSLHNRTFEGKKVNLGGGDALYFYSWIFDYKIKEVIIRNGIDP